MAYIKETKSVTKARAFENLRAVVNSEYFAGYEMHHYGNTIISDAIHVEHIGGFKSDEHGAPTGPRFKLEELTTMLTGIIDTVSQDGNYVRSFNIALSPTEAELRKMGFEDSLFEEDFNLPVNFGVHQTGSSPTHLFKAYNLGLKESFFEGMGGDFADAQRLVKNWYRRIDRALQNMLPEPISRPW